MESIYPQSDADALRSHDPGLNAGAFGLPPGAASFDGGRRRQYEGDTGTAERAGLPALRCRRLSALLCAARDLALMDINQLYTAALAAQKSGQEAEAERLYRQILEQASPPEALVNLGNLLARQGRRDEAQPLYDRALAARPDFLEGLFNRAGLLLVLKRPDDALENYERVVTLRPDLFIAWINRGSALRALQRHEMALASFERAAALI